MRRAGFLGIALLAQALVASPALAEPTGAAVLASSDLVDVTASNLAGAATSSLAHNLSYDLSFLQSPTREIAQSGSEPAPDAKALSQSVLTTGLISALLGGLDKLVGSSSLQARMLTQTGTSTNSLPEPDSLGNGASINQTATVVLPSAPAGGAQPLAIVVQSASQDGAGRQGATNLAAGVSMGGALNLLTIP